jgi:lipopolysaccharide biosynthesis glycosyltransferase
MVSSENIQAKLYILSMLYPEIHIYIHICMQKLMKKEAKNLKEIMEEYIGGFEGKNGKKF